MNYRLRTIEKIAALKLLENVSLDLTDRMGDKDAAVFGDTYFGPLSNAQPGTIAFARRATGSSPDDLAAQIADSRASVVITDSAAKGRVSSSDGQLIIFSENPRLDFIRLFRQFIEEYKPDYMKPTDFLSSCTVGPNVNVELGAVLGEGVRLFGNNYISASVRIADNVEVFPGAVVGCEGFGFVRDGGGKLINFPHLGGVVIETDVSIGAGTCIDRGNFGDTVLKRGCKLDNLVYIAHNAIVGEDTLVCAQVSIAGATKIGAGCRIAPSAAIRDGVTVGDNCLVGMSACVVGDIPSGKIVYGIPARIRGDRD